MCKLHKGSRYTAICVYNWNRFASCTSHDVFGQMINTHSTTPHTYTGLHSKVDFCVTNSDFSPMDVNSPCALLQTQINGGPLGSFLMQNRNKPLQILGMLAGGISLMVIVTVIISTATFIRNKKSNRIVPNRRVRRRKQKDWNLRNPFKKPESPGEKFRVEEEEQEPDAIVENVNHNNNISTAVRHWPLPPPPPPCAPSLPPPPPAYIPGQRQWAVPTVSATVSIKPKKKPVISRQDTVNRAMVSELKMRLEQKRMTKHH